LFGGHLVRRLTSLGLRDFDKLHGLRVCAASPVEAGERTYSTDAPYLFAASKNGFIPLPGKRNIRGKVCL